MNKIGLEIHVQLATDSKLFCSCPVMGNDEPNTRTCPVCLGMPGSKPVLNKKAVDFALRIAFALNCKVNKEFFFSRKTYFYPDLAKNFQITQYEVPVGEEGFVQLEDKKVGITRIHLEEDPASLVHLEGMGKSNYSLVDYNRSGIPLVEIVTEPELSSPKEARLFLDKLLTDLNYLGVYAHGDGVLKADCNISTDGNERVEVKNVTGFRAVEDALKAEAERQKIVLAKGGVIERQTRAFDAEKKSTFLLRKKESEDDYGYINDTDLVKVELSDELLSKARGEMPELADSKVKRFMSEFNLKEYDAKVLASNKGLAELFEKVAEVDTSVAIRIISRELAGVLNYNKMSVSESGVNADDLKELALLFKDGKVSDKNVKQAIIAYVSEAIKPRIYLEKNNLLIDDLVDYSVVVEKIIKENPEAFEQFKSGNTKSLNFLLGKAMRELKGKADAKKLKEFFDSKK